ncbi:acylneuraminate cytidylyltransferase [Agromyces tardus]|uniref:Acylneuraminate cytidylyltransferase n=1 Tax=Agromyces tardus TaxID=2583849 RepID=A0A3M8A1R8_9MICO|nr:acylneuraminate cytidylyltransferase [Agromyces tardus]
MRPAELAGSEASSESALLHAIGVLGLETGLEQGLDTPQAATRPAGGGLETPQAATRPAGGGLETRPEGAPRPAQHHRATRAAQGEGAARPAEGGITVFVQATSPFIDSVDLDAAIARVEAGDRDVVFAAAPTHVFLWREVGGRAVGVNHEMSRRPRRQDREPEYAETGAFYVFRTDGFVAARHRFFGRVGIQPVHPDHAIEIDDAADLGRARALAPHVDRALAESGLEAGAAARGDRSGGVAARHPLIDVDALVTDFDGVHTDDTAAVDELGRESVRVSRADGAGVARLRAAGIPVLIISAEANPVVARRAEKLGVECLHGVAAKGEALAAWASARGIRLDRIAYLGNDRNDVPALELVGWPVVVPDAAPDALAEARHVLHRRGGHGAVRELADVILASRAHLAADATPPPDEGAPEHARTGPVPTRAVAEARAAASATRP